MNKEFQTLYGVTKNNKIKTWTIIVNQDAGKNEANIITISGLYEGKMKITEKTISKGKNIGKSNETTPYEQALLEAESKWKKQLNKNYNISKPNLNNYVPNIILPMLAKPPKKGKIKFPCFMQPKLNGICNLSEIKDNKVIHHSRGGKEFQFLEYLDKYIKKLNCHVPLHGELYKHGWSLQKIGSYVKELKDDRYDLEFWIYDIADPNMTFKERNLWLQKNINHEYNNSPIKYTPTIIVEDYNQVDNMHDEYVKNGFEGGMLKNINGYYLYQYNSNDIEKVKSFIDDEFKIIGGKEGTGLDKGCIIFKCITNSGKEFDVRPIGTVNERKNMFDNLSKYIGKKLTVKFAEYTEEGCPSQPVGLIIRDYE
jgi:DNA ligase-1